MKRVLLLSFVLFIAACAGPARAPRTAIKGDRVQVFLEYQGRARSICAVGDFNQWRPGVDVFTEVSPGRWRLRLEVSPGRYHYLLRVEKEDGLHLIHDPSSRNEMKDGLGRRLSVLDLSASMSDTSGNH
jgi:hypothetical protein